MALKKLTQRSEGSAELWPSRSKMPGLIGVNEFVDETREDYNSPTTSTFVSRMPQCRQTVSNLEEVSLQKNP